MLTNLLDLDDNLSVRDVHKEEKSSKRSTGILNKIISFKYCFSSTVFVSFGQLFSSNGRISGVIL